MQNIFTNIKCSEIILSNANENWYIILYDLFSRLCYIATCEPFCKDATHMKIYLYRHFCERCVNIPRLVDTINLQHSTHIVFVNNYNMSLAIVNIYASLSLITRLNIDVKKGCSN